MGHAHAGEGSCGGEEGGRNVCYFSFCLVNMNKRSRISVLNHNMPICHICIIMLSL